MPSCRHEMADFLVSLVVCYFPCCLLFHLLFVISLAVCYFPCCLLFPLLFVISLVVCYFPCCLLFPLLFVSILAVWKWNMQLLKTQYLVTCKFKLRAARKWSTSTTEARMVAAMQRRKGLLPPRHISGPSTTAHVIPPTKPWTRLSDRARSRGAFWGNMCKQLIDL